MTIKKLTVAAAIAVGIATCSLNQAMAACPCEQANSPAPCNEPMPTVTGGACPCEQQAQPATTCDKCHKALPDCDCAKDDEDITPPPCPNEDKKSDCGSPATVGCDKTKDAARAVSPQIGKPAKKDMKQVYAYPN